MGHVHCKGIFGGTGSYRSSPRENNADTVQPKAICDANVLERCKTFENNLRSIIEFCLRRSFVFDISDYYVYDFNPLNYVSYFK